MNVVIKSDIALLQQTLVDEAQRGNGQLASPQSSLLNGSVPSATATTSAALLAAVQQQHQSQMQQLLQLSGAAGLGNQLQNAYLQQQQLQVRNRRLPTASSRALH